MIRVIICSVLATVLLLAIGLRTCVTSCNCVGGKVDPNRQYMAEINNAVERWYFDTGSWPKDDLSDLIGHPDYFPDGLPEHPLAEQGGVYVLGKDHRVDTEKAFPEK